MGVDCDAVLSELDGAIAALPKVGGDSSEVYMSSELSRVLSAAEKAAKSMGDEYLSVEHLMIGIFAAGIIGLALGDLDIPLFAQSIWNGFTGMNEVFFLSLFCGGMSEMIAHNGGITWLIEKLGRMMKGNKSAQVGVAALVSLADCATANNTVAIIVSGPMAKNMSRIHKVDPRRTASLLDVFSCVLQGMIPWGAQLLTAASLTTIYGVTMNPIDILPYMWYCWILAAVGILSIFIPFADGICRKDPWNWEYDVAESGVAAKKASLELERQESAQTPI